MLEINIVGAGKLGRTLGRLWAQHGVFAVQDVLAARTANAAAAVEFIGAGSAPGSLAAMRRAPLWMLTVPDGRIAALCESLSKSRMLRAGDVVFHCSGSESAAALAAAARCGAFVASVHPVKSIAEPARAVQTFAGTWCGAEGDARALAVLAPAFGQIGARLFAVDPEAKTVYHAASVIACNYLAALVHAGVQCYERAGLDRSMAREVMEPLVRETLDNIFELGPADALTGPIARGDAAVVARQHAALAQWNPRIARIYRALGAAALELARARESADADSLAAIERTLSGP